MRPGEAVNPVEPERLNARLAVRSLTEAEREALVAVGAERSREARRQAHTSRLAAGGLMALGAATGVILAAFVGTDPLWMPLSPLLALGTPGGLALAMSTAAARRAAIAQAASETDVQLGKLRELELRVVSATRVGTSPGPTWVLTLEDGRRLAVLAGESWVVDDAFPSAEVRISQAFTSAWGQLLADGAALPFTQGASTGDAPAPTLTRANVAWVAAEPTDATDAVRQDDALRAAWEL
jgi:hypothetical protein